MTASAARGPVPEYRLNFARRISADATFLATPTDYLGYPLVPVRVENRDDGGPADHGSDRYDYVEVSAPNGVDPPDELLAELDPPCPDCRANLFLRYVGRAGDDSAELRFWRPTIAHDDGCPAFAGIEAAR